MSKHTLLKSEHGSPHDGYDEGKLSERARKMVGDSFLSERDTGAQVAYSALREQYREIFENPSAQDALWKQHGAAFEAQFATPPPVEAKVANVAMDVPYPEAARSEVISGVGQGAMQQVGTTIEAPNPAISAAYPQYQADGQFLQTETRSLDGGYYDALTQPAAEVRMEESV